MVESLLTDVQRSFGPHIKRHGFRQLRAATDPRDFGNAVVVLESEGYSIRIVRDRDQIFLELGSPLDTGQWYSLGRVLAAVRGDLEEEEALSGRMSLRCAASVIESAHAELTHGLGPLEFGNTKRRLDRLGAEAKHRLLRLFRRRNDRSTQSIVQPSQISPPPRGGRGWLSSLVPPPASGLEIRFEVDLPGAHTGACLGAQVSK
jgi:hypothetical protein